VKNVFELPLQELLYFVKVSCHDGLHDLLPEVRELCGCLDRSQLTSFVKNFVVDIQRHLIDEETNLFPLIETDISNTLKSSIEELMHEHNKIKMDIIRMRELTHNYTPHLELDPNGMKFYKRLKEMDRILINHIQIENDILFPMVLNDH
jgi:iron-sulfur cluster repair protein YtfE (RIC family)